jgi:IclR family acetate operon transcriptional repressor
LYVKTITSLSALKVDLMRVRANGYAVNDQEHAPNLRAVAVPLIMPSGGYLLSVCVRGSFAEFQLDQVPEYARDIAVVMRDIARRFFEV